jgi:FkbM family methyltransferase
VIVIDIGCARYGGDYSIERLVEEFNPDTLYGFDPNGEVFASVPAKAERADLKRWVLPNSTELMLEQKAAWLYDGKIGYLSETLNSALTDRTDVQQVECFDLSEFIYELTRHTSEAPRIVLKMDAEGSEYDLLDRLIATGADKLLELAWIEWHPGRIPNGAQRRKTIEERISCPITEWLW